MRWKCPCSVPAEMFFLIWLVKLQERVKRVDTFVRDIYNDYQIIFEVAQQE